MAWFVVIALVAWGPLAGSIWWKQVNLLVMALAFGGWALLGKRSGWAAALIGLSIAIKPLAILLPVFLVFHRDTRRAAIASIGWVIGPNAIGLAYLAWRAHDTSAADPIAYYNHWTDRTVGAYVCTKGPISPASLGCRLLGTQHLDVTRLLVLATLGIVTLLALGTLRGCVGTSFRVLAWACLLSPMVGTIEWPHYQIMFAPMLILLVVSFIRGRGPFQLVVATAVAYALTTLVWYPAMSLPYQVSSWFGGHRETLPALYRILTITMLGQYLLIAVGLSVWSGTAGTRPLSESDMASAPHDAGVRP